MSHVRVTFGPTVNNLPESYQRELQELTSSSTAGKKINHNQSRPCLVTTILSTRVVAFNYHRFPRNILITMIRLNSRLARNVFKAHLQIFPATLEYV